MANNNFWITPVTKDDGDLTVIDTIRRHMKYKIYAISKNSPHKKMKKGDWICFDADKIGVVAHGRLETDPKLIVDESINSEIKGINDPLKHPYYFRLKDVVEYYDDPLDYNRYNLWKYLDFFRDKGDKSSGRLRQNTRLITLDDFLRITRLFRAKVIDQWNAKALVEGFEKNEIIIHQSIYCKPIDFPNRFYLLLTDKQIYELSPLGKKLNADTFYLKDPYIVIIDTDYKILNNNNLETFWKEACSNDLFDIWDPINGPLKHMKKNNRYVVSLLRIYKINKSFMEQRDYTSGSETGKHRDFKIPINLENIIIKPILSQYEFDSIKEKLENTFSKTGTMYTKKIMNDTSIEPFSSFEVFSDLYNQSDLNEISILKEINKFYKTPEHIKQIQLEEEYIENLSNNVPVLTEDTKTNISMIKKIARDSAFQKTIRLGYDNACAVCGKRRYNKLGHPEIEAAHIYPKYMRGSDDPRNGIGLCKLHHWAFDNGLFSISDELRVIVNQEIKKDENYQEIYLYENLPIFIPKDNMKIPHSIYLKEHRKLHQFE